MTGKVCLDDDKIGQMGLQRQPPEKGQSPGCKANFLPSVAEIA
jgi:hypothetical protein